MLTRSVIHEMVGPLVAAVLATVGLLKYETSNLDFFKVAQSDGSIEISVADIAPEAAPPVPTVVVTQVPNSPIQKVTVSLNIDNSFAKAGDQYNMHLPDPNRDPNIRFASLTQPQKLPSVVIKPQQPKQPTRKIIWDELTNGKERRNFIIRYVKSHGFVCPKSGKTDAQEEEELQTYYPWSLVIGYIQGHCPLKGQQASAPLG